MDINTFRAIVFVYALLAAYNGRIPFLMNFKGGVLLPKPLLWAPLLLEGNLLLYFGNNSLLIDFKQINVELEQTENQLVEKINAL